MSIIESRWKGERKKAIARGRIVGPGTPSVWHRWLFIAFWNRNGWGIPLNIQPSILTPPSNELDTPKQHSGFGGHMKDILDQMEEHIAAIRNLQRNFDFHSKRLEKLMSSLHEMNFEMEDGRIKEVFDFDESH